MIFVNTEGFHVQWMAVWANELAYWFVSGGCLKCPLPAVKDHF
jgi:hypothetical protein